MSATEILPGWYPDPVAVGYIRYWDGTGWTDHTAAPLAGVTTFPTGTTPEPPLTPRARRRRPPLPALFVAGTVLIGFPLAIAIGVLAARASAPPPLELPSAETVDHPELIGGSAPADDPADAAAQTDIAAIGVGIKRFYQQTPQGGIAAPVVTVSGDTYILGPVNTGTTLWEWPPIAMSDGVSLGGQTGTRQDDWC
ncbi:MAG: DUF2510 domain-containing protein, partial [Demequinaceae bacterium]|nr:DUF2510 domain-containing protein [Demequinaceae bacterium]